MREDLTFSDSSAFGSVRWAATTLGRGSDWFRRNLKALVISGFPEPDPITNLYLKADVLAWLDRRRQIPDRVPHATPQGGQEGTIRGVNYNAL